MKTIITAVILSASLNVFAEASPGAFDKLKQMFDSGNSPTSMDAVYAELSKIKSCAGSTQSSPNDISTVAKPIKVTYTKPAFGPNFPSEVLTGIAFNSTPTYYGVVSSDFFSTYTENLTSYSLELNTVAYYVDRQVCDKDDDGFIVCDNVDKTSSFIESQIRINGNFLVYSRGNQYAYCWK
ncbi:hypothetical protein K2P97_10405 [bacterium]|nr:hypothetical protein [bacterium]